MSDEPVNTEDDAGEVTESAPDPEQAADPVESAPDPAPVEVTPEAPTQEVTGEEE